MKCPDDMDHFANASETPCSDLSCSDTDVHLCCGEDHKCDTFICPSGTVLKTIAHLLHCHGFECADHDSTTCCEPMAQCHSINLSPQPNGCPHKMIRNPEALLAPCAERSCSSADAPTCCIEGMICAGTGQGSGKTCPEHYSLREDA